MKITIQIEEEQFPSSHKVDTRFLHLFMHVLEIA